MSADSKQKILEAASAIFLRDGLNALSVRAIARQAKVSTIGIYSHFQGKQGVLDALYIEGFEKLLHAMAVPEQQSAVATVLLAAQNYLDNAEQFEAHYRLIFGDSGQSYQPSEQARRVSTAAFARLTELVATILPNNASAAEQRDAALEMWALLHGFVSLKHHAAAELVALRNWKDRAYRALQRWIAALPEGNSHRSP